MFNFHKKEAPLLGLQGSGGGLGFLSGGGAAGLEFAVSGGGSLSDYNSYEVATFTSPGTLTVSGEGNAHILVVAGGGGGGSGNGGFGGGGAGAVSYTHLTLPTICSV